MKSPVSGRFGHAQGTLQSHRGDRETIAQAMKAAGNFAMSIIKERSTFFHLVVRSLSGYTDISLA